MTDRWHQTCPTCNGTGGVEVGAEKKPSTPEAAAERLLDDLRAVDLRVWSGPGGGDVEAARVEVARQWVLRCMAWGRGDG